MTILTGIFPIRVKKVIILMFSSSTFQITFNNNFRTPCSKAKRNNTTDMVFTEEHPFRTNMCKTTCNAISEQTFLQQQRARELDDFSRELFFPVQFLRLHVRSRHCVLASLIRVTMQHNSRRNRTRP
jgi:hypothetical protein